MTTARFFRQIHYWTSLPLLVTIFIIAITGCLLSLKKDFASLQPPTQVGSRPGDLHRSVSDLVLAVAAVPKFEKVRWQDIERIDIRPADGVAKMILHNRTELQVDLSSGRVLQVGYRTSDWLETIHDFSFIGGWSKYVFSFGSGLLLLAMVVTGIYLFVLPLVLKRRRKGRAK